MKKLFKIIIEFFLRIWNFLFGSKKVETPKEAPQEQFTNKPIIPMHNNRRNTRGRFVQYINMGEGRQRAIYHSCK